MLAQVRPPTFGLRDRDTRVTQSAFQELLEEVGEADEFVFLEEPADPQVFRFVGEAGVHRR